VRSTLIRHEMSQCESIAKKDTIIDTLYHKIWRELLSYMIEDAKTIEVAETILHIAKQLERIGDHITNIAERICYLQSGKMPDLNE
jgi:phosphate transport system protein